MLNRFEAVSRTLTGLLIVTLWSTAAAAQSSSAEGAPDPTTVHIRLGPVWVRPTVALTNLGVDTNVFHVADSDQPQSDFTFTATPQAEFWLPIGRTWVTSSIKEDLVWYQKFENERAVNSNNSIGWLAPLNRVKFTVGTIWLNAQDRPGYEIDARAQRTEHDYAGAVEFRALARTLIGVRADRRTIDFAEDQVFDGSNLHDELNRSELTMAATLRHELTPLTSLTLDLLRLEDRFDYNPLRNSDSTQINVGLKFAPDALINGSAVFGYRDFKPLVSGLAGFTGGTMAVNVGYVFRATTKIGVQLTRDVQYSYDVNQPYYLLTGGTATVTQQIYGPLDLEGRVGAQRLAYQTREGVDAELDNRVDRVRSYGGGIGYRFGGDLRIGFNVDDESRTSGIDGRNYSGLRFGTSATYIF